MTTLVFFAVICAAILHAVWNAMVKSGSDNTGKMAAVVIGNTPLALLCIPFVPFPSPESWPYLAGGVLLHFGYQVFLLFSYRIGDLTQVYPIARGTAPLLVAGFSLFILGVELEPTQILAILIIASGLISLSLVRQQDGGRNRAAAVLAVCTGVFIAGYSLVDGIGARLAGTSLGFFSWLTIFDSILFALFVSTFNRQAIRDIPTKNKRAFLIGGSASFCAYALVVWGFTQAPIAVVTALRETSIIFALFIGVFVLKERLDLAKVIATMFTLCGAALLKFSR